ncbi:MAG: hypothetical protein JKY02_10470 [Flavobacteriaceae bacterium]|nr:hypothetical protein [Flavobacteriaceae bacterium]
MKYITSLLLILIISGEYSSQEKYTLRKYPHVKQFYKGISKKATELCLENNIPPASLLAIAGLESGWDSGYIGQITGNILSLGPRKRDIQLPALRLPILLESNKIIYDSLDIIKFDKKSLQWQNRPKSIKKDYRPKPWAGTPYNLAYFKYHPKEKHAAQIANINDFATVFIGRKSRIKAYRETRRKMDSLVAKHGKKILLEEKTAIQFIYGIGGKLNSYNYRETWPKKVIYIIKRAGLTELTTDLHTGKRFNESWR